MACVTAMHSTNSAPICYISPGGCFAVPVAQKGKVGLGRVANVTSIDVSLIFGDQLVRTSSATQTGTLSNSSELTLTRVRLIR